jgi:hypothetical protein
MSRRNLIGSAVLSILMIVLVAVIVDRFRWPPEPQRTSQGRGLASTWCTRNGPIFYTFNTRVPEEDRMPVRAHEEVHADQCRQLGWLRIRMKNLTTSGRLSLEAPGYCAGAQARLRRGDNFAITRERMFDDANAMFAGDADSARVNAALRASCPEIASAR